jgi:hypothetical protein
LVLSSEAFCRFDWLARQTFGERLSNLRATSQSDLDLAFHCPYDTIILLWFCISVEATTRADFRTFLLDPDEKVEVVFIKGKPLGFSMVSSLKKVCMAGNTRS